MLIIEDTNKKRKAIIGFSIEDIAWDCHESIGIIKNGVRVLEVPIEILKKLHIYLFPDTAVLFEPDKDNIKIEYK